MGSVVDVLEERGLVERRPKPGDRRVWMVAATPEGDATAERVSKIDERLRLELRAGISRRERRELTQRNLAEARQQVDEDRTRLLDLGRRIEGLTEQVHEADAVLDTTATQVAAAEEQARDIVRDVRAGAFDTLGDFPERDRVLAAIAGRGLLAEEADEPLEAAS